MVVSSFWGGDCWNYAREALTEKVFKKTDVGDFDNARTADTKFYVKVQIKNFIINKTMIIQRF